MSDIKVGKLYIVGLPIGNLEDISLRVRNTLEEVDVVASEDTRDAKKILSYLDIKSQLVSYHDHSDGKKINELISYLRKGKSIALISDSGMPLISDPGFKLVREAIDCEIIVTVIPGPCAAIAALASSGLPTDRFIFEGFFSKKISNKESLFYEKRTIIFYESVHRIKETIKELIKIFGPERKAVVSRELTKIYESIYRGTLLEIMDKLERGLLIKKGEFVILVSGSEKELSSNDSEIIRIYNILNKNLSSSESINLTSKITRNSRNYIYRLMRVRD